jgi:pyridoxamine 5'-phosphate oxidase
MTNITEQLQKLRLDYSKMKLSEADIDANPIKQFETWMTDAVNAQVNEPNAMVLSTVAHGKPSSRVVLLRGVADKHFKFFTNYHSKKAEHIEHNKNACLNFFWPELERQIRIEGELEKLNEAESDAYFKTRPRDSQIGAWASVQSAELKSREELEEKVIALTKKLEGAEIKRPPYWGGYALNANYIEFWQGRSNRLHDRIAYELKNNEWKKFRLYP